MAQADDPDRWAQWRFSIVGPLLAAPPLQGQLRTALQALADKTWSHPIDGTAVHVSFATIERWFYQARKADQPVIAGKLADMGTELEAARLLGFHAAWLKDTGRVNYVAVTDTEALDAFQMCTRLEGIIPALEPSHALAHVMKIAPELPADHIIVMNMCGRGDKDIFTVARHLGFDMSDTEEGRDTD